MSNKNSQDALSTEAQNAVEEGDKIRKSLLGESEKSSKEAKKEDKKDDNKKEENLSKPEDKK